MENIPAVLVEVLRGDLIESLHRGRLSIVNSSGKELLKLGNTQKMTFLRSGAKPFQLLPLVEKGLIKKFNFTSKELAVMSSSHSGEPIHLKAVRSILHKIGLDENYLRCGIHPPLSQEYHDKLKLKGLEPSAIHNNCSGKHAAMLAMAVAEGYSLEDYYLPNHPVQRLILQTLSELAEYPQKNIILATDGCGVPVFALPLYRTALLYARLADSSCFESRRREALTKIAQAMQKHPEMVGGNKGRLCTDLMRQFPKQLVAKWGSEGFFGIGIFPSVIERYIHGVGIAIKIEDGNSQRALGPAVIELLAQLGLLNQDLLKKLKPYHQPTIYNHHNIVVGKIRASFVLSQ